MTIGICASDGLDFQVIRHRGTHLGSARLIILILLVSFGAWNLDAGCNISSAASLQTLVASFILELLLNFGGPCSLISRDH